jgi:hypothetical protein
MIKHSNKSVFSLRKKHFMNKFPLITKESISCPNDHKTIQKSNCPKEIKITSNLNKSIKCKQRNSSSRIEHSEPRVQKSISSKSIFISSFKTSNIYQFHSSLLKLNKKKFKQNLLNVKTLNKLNYSETQPNVLTHNKTEEIDNKIQSFIIKKTEETKFNQRFLSKNTKGEEKKLLTNEIKRLQQKTYLHTNNSRRSLPKLTNKSYRQRSEQNETKFLIHNQINKISYIKVLNPFFELNREGKIPVLMEDGHCLLSLLNDSFRYLHNKK